ncbi:CHAD domain-containing protein [Sulfuricurvum sp.]|uniref:CHAD domain-containing protein n=1 Tax=Sulfuricurvum sp. TaxID=2025608 RepID=UPI002617B6F4|nr:CHAD domain-containing protein [Sulfuricurvum sp.]MDD2266493.1 CHAD domain-containing protein [Sulfuricurvum sp.]MDD2782701.1 CHAD domain-containing protein [Sulfuricurvum sp.]
MKPTPLTQYLLYQLYHGRIKFQEFHADRHPASLHAFRIAMRKVRSIAKLLLDETTFAFPQFLKEGIKTTNDLRELDVLIGSLEKYPKIRKELLLIRPKQFEERLSELFCEALLQNLDATYTLIYESDPAIFREIAVQKVLTHYQHCLDELNALTGDEKPKDLHKLRIMFKDARYGFEFLNVSDLHPSAELIDYCRTMQERLGHVQDYVNQLEWLTTFAAENPALDLSELIAKRKKKLKKLKESAKDTTRSV